MAHLFEALSTAQPQHIALSLVGIFLLYHVSIAIWSVFFSPLSHIPGPWYAHITRAFYVGHMMKGTTATWLKQLHDKYGDVVRYTPNDISFISGETAWQDIYGFRTGRSKHAEIFHKDLAYYAPAKHMISAGDGDHGRMRRIISHAFSDKALREQEPLIQSYVDLLVDRLKQVNAANPGKPVDLTTWYDWTTFDVIADLFFGKAFGCLQELKAHRYVELILASVRAVGLFYVMHYWPIVKLLSKTILRKTMAARIEFRSWCYDQGQARIDATTSRRDFISAILENNEKKDADAGVSELEIKEHGILFLIAGTETTATTMAAATAHLLKNPAKLEKLKREVRGRFAKNDDITIEAVGQCEYMLAVLNESLRLMPPVPAGFQRKVPVNGATVSGTYIPGNLNASVGVSQYPTNHSERNFRDAESFIPERWMGDARFKDDNRAAFNPFSFGPRNCLGKNLAYAEMRIMLAKMVFNFDWELDEHSSGWLHGMKVHTLWQKPPLLVKLTAVT